MHLPLKCIPWGGLLFSFMIFVGSAVAEPSWKTVPPDHEAVRTVGRFTEDFQFAWTGSAMEILFTGSGAEVLLEAEKPKGVGFAVVIDGKPAFLHVRPGQEIYRVGQNLDPQQEHHLRIFRNSEASFGTVQFKGFRFPEETTVRRPEARERRMLFIGDSITCAYGNEAATVKEGNTVENQNAWLGYAARTARHFNADAHYVCWSGRGLFRNRWLEHDQNGTLPKIMDEILPESPAAPWSPENFVPDIVVINLGTNDSSVRNGQKPPLSKTDFVSTYHDFIRTLREQSPESVIFLTLGPMQYQPITRPWLKAAAEPFENTHIFLYPPMKAPNDLGGHYHPNVAKHQSMADELSEAIKTHTSWSTSTSRLDGYGSVLLEWEKKTPEIFLTIHD